MASSIILTSNDEGETWEISYPDSTGALPIDLLQPMYSGPIFALRDSSLTGPSILRTTNGATFDSFNDPAIIAGLNATPLSIAYDLVKDELYISYTGTTSIYALMNASQVEPAAANAALASAADSGLLLITGALPYWRRITPRSTVGRGPRTLLAIKLARIP